MCSETKSAALGAGSTSEPNGAGILSNLGDVCLQLVTQNGWFITENSISKDDFGVTGSMEYRKSFAWLRFCMFESRKNNITR